MSVLPYLIYKFNIIPIKIPTGLFKEMVLKFLSKCKGHAISKTTLKKNKVGGFQTKSIVLEESLVSPGVKSYWPFLSNAPLPQVAPIALISAHVDSGSNMASQPLIHLRFLTPVQLIESPCFWRDCTMAVSPICPVCL